MTCDFITHLLTYRHQMDVVWVIVDRLIKSMHFISIQPIIYQHWLDNIEIRTLDSTQFPMRSYQIGTIDSLLPSRNISRENLVRKPSSI